MHVLAYDYYSDSPSITRGLALTASLIAAARAESDACLLLDNGDFLQGSPLGDFLAENSQTKRQPHPMIAAMNGLEYDAANLGNHEFSHGLPFLRNTLQQVAFPIVSANLRDGNGTTHLTPPYVILDRKVTDGAGRSHTLRIGIIGFAPPQTVLWEQHLLLGQVTASDIVETARFLVPEIKAEGADIIVALSHSGIGQDEAEAGQENASVPLAAIDGIDAIIAGHTHLVFPSPGHPATSRVDPDAGTLNGKPAVMPGSFGSHLGVIDLLLEQGPNTRWHVAAHQSRVRAIARRDAFGHTTSQTRPDNGVTRAAAKAHAAALIWARRPVCQTTQPLHSYFALVTPSPAIRLVAQAQAAHVTAKLRDTPFESLPVLSASAPFKAGGRGGPENYSDVPAGDFALRHAADLYIHPNTITALRITGANVANWLERAASIFRQIPACAQDAPLLDPKFPSFDFDMIEGVTFQVDLSQPARYDPRGGLVDANANRIKELRWQGFPIAPDARFALATNTYRASGTGHFAGAATSNIIFTGTELIRDLVQQHIQSDHIREIDPLPNWRFAPMPGTTVTFPTSPKARDHLSDLHHFAGEPLGLNEQGFLSFRLHL